MNEFSFPDFITAAVGWFVFVFLTTAAIRLGWKGLED